jgi:hypothetical protein
MGRCAVDSYRARISSTMMLALAVLGAALIIHHGLVA